MAYNPCSAAIARNIQQDCESPIVGGYTGKGILIPVDSVYSVVQDAENRRLIQSIAGEEGGHEFVVIDNVSVLAPFAGSSTAANAENGIREYTKTLSFRIPLRGGDVSKDLVEPLGGGAGFIAVVEKRDNGNPLGKYEVIGFLSPLKVTDDGIQRTEAENGGAIIATMSCSEAWFEANLVGAKTTGSNPQYTLANAKKAWEDLFTFAI
jgi:hypothetical protein